jgi:hypothetical protein
LDSEVIEWVANIGHVLNYVEWFIIDTLYYSRQNKIYSDNFWLIRLFKKIEYRIGPKDRPQQVHQVPHMCFHT